MSGIWQYKHKPSRPPSGSGSEFLAAKILCSVLRSIEFASFHLKSSLFSLILLFLHLVLLFGWLSSSISVIAAIVFGSLNCFDSADSSRYESFLRLFEVFFVLVLLLFGRYSSSLSLFFFHSASYQSLNGKSIRIWTSSSHFCVFQLITLVLGLVCIFDEFPSVLLRFDECRLLDDAVEGSLNKSGIITRSLNASELDLGCR